MQPAAPRAEQTDPSRPRQSARRMLYRAFEPQAGPGKLSKLNLTLCVAIVSSAALAVLETEPAISDGRATLFHLIELGFAAIFACEYVLRIWIAPERSPERPAWRARLRWMISPPAIVDLVAFLPALLLLTGAPTLVLRLIRLLRIVRLANLGPMSFALELVLRTLLARRHELGVTFAVGGVVLIFYATLLHALEGVAQPDAFGSIPRALWWGVITLTTIGYGDVYPITPLGKFVAGLAALTSVGLIAAPTGILAAGFAEALRRDRSGSSD